jgi:DNA-binding IclR family transcriptional regulator
MAQNESGTIKSDYTLIRIIEALKELSGAGVTEVADHVGQRKGTVHKHLKTLAEEGYVTNNDGLYQLSFEFFNLGGYVRDNTMIHVIGRKHVTEISNQLDEMVLLGIKERDHGHFIFRSKDKYGLMQSIPIGEQFELHQTATGKAILAELPKPEVERIVENTGLPKSTEQTITDRETLIEELEKIRNQGYAINMGEKSSSIWGVSAAIRNPNGGEMGAITVSMPESKISEQKITNEYSDAVIDAASSITLQLKHGQY